MRQRRPVYRLGPETKKLYREVVVKGMVVNDKWQCSNSRFPASHQASFCIMVNKEPVRIIVGEMMSE